MKASSDDMYEKFKDDDFADAKPVAQIPALAQLQAESGGKTRITMRVDSTVLAMFKARAEMAGGSYQSMMNDALKQFLQGQALADVVRKTIQQELKAALESDQKPASL
ncbi:BrnA antitoxin family protein [Thiothrix nivea]|uniref:CopG family transcriptional regulator n=1 Tax=Thiothrix nivea (strain ATCC 35100 / DSM 5205 / JP2) TaxID=870187 RepID=A0A656HGB8_THINJ|nr:BrnA antitoxin family protein [Thiothrix nivea]EIJ34075.1 hypothetical protein Thini_1472 [Thiothrix nivea DSM 5205]